MWGSAAPVCAEMGGLKHLGSILSLFWLSIGPGALVAEPIATALISYSRRSLHREGADAFLITIGLSGGCFIAAGLVLLGGKRWKQGSWKVMQKT